MMNYEDSYADLIEIAEKLQSAYQEKCLDLHRQKINSAATINALKAEILMLKKNEIKLRAQSATVRDED